MRVHVTSTEDDEAAWELPLQRPQAELPRSAVQLRRLLPRVDLRRQNAWMTVPILSILVLVLTGRAWPAALTPYKPGEALINAENYRVAKLLSIPWGKAKGQVGQARLHSRGALSYSPRYLSVSPKGDIYIGDEVNQRILRFDGVGKPVSCFSAAYGGYHLSVDGQGNLYTVFRRPFQPFTIAVYRDDKVVKEIGLSYFKRNPAGDRIWVDHKGDLHFNLIHSYQPLKDFTEPEERQTAIENLITGERWEYTALCHKCTLASVRTGYLSKYFDRVYVLSEGNLITRNMAGVVEGQVPVKELVTEQIGLEEGVSLDIGNALRVFGEDPSGNIYLLVRNRIKTPGTCAFSIVKLSSNGKILFAADAYPNDVHYGSEVQFYPSSLDVDPDGNIYQLCTEGESGVKVMKWSK